MGGAGSLSSLAGWGHGSKPWGWDRCLLPRVAAQDEVATRLCPRQPVVWARAVEPRNRLFHPVGRPSSH